MKTTAKFRVRAGQRESFVLNYRPSHLDIQPPINAAQALKDTQRLWRSWSGRCSYRGRWRARVIRSLITLKALTYKPTGGVIAACTTSLPEKIGGMRNWDYRYCWLRDATAFTLNALLLAGYENEAAAWREWLLRAVAGSPQDLQILYGVTGVRRLDEFELTWLSGYRGIGAGARIGNAASTTISARCVRRSHGHSASGARRGLAARTGGVEGSSRAAQASRIALDAAR